MSFNQNNGVNSCDLGNWFNEPDEKTIEIINDKLVCEENESSEQNNFNSFSNHFQISEYDNDNDNDKGDDDCSENIKVTIVEDILNKNPNDMSSNELIQCECHIAYYVQILMEGSNGNNKIKSIKTHDNDLTFDKMQSIVDYLSWISLASETLAKKINQEILIYKPESKPSIVRSSYNFCAQYTRCKNFYSKHEIPNCKEHHYVHSLLKYDIDSVILFLNYIITNEFTMTREELNNLYLSIKTICFVTRHMQKEISYIDYITKNKSEIFHRNNPIDLNKKKVIKKIWSENDKNNRIDHPMRKDRHGEQTNFSSRRDSGSFLGTVDRKQSFLTDSRVDRVTDKRNNYSLNKNHSQSRPNSCGFKKSDTIKINKPKDFINNRFSVLSNN